MKVKNLFLQIQLILFVSIVSNVHSAPLLSDLFARFFNYDSNSRVVETTVIDQINETVNYSLPRIWLTVSPVVDVDTKNVVGAHNTSAIRAVEVHWESSIVGPNVGDHLELHQITSPLTSKLIRRFTLRDENGRTLPKYIKTDVEFPYLNGSQLDALVQKTDFVPLPTKYGNISGRCLHFYLVYLDQSGTFVKAINCIQVNARWMEREFSIIKNQTLQEIMIPGTHDATSYEKYDITDYEGNVISRFQYTQDESLYAQLVYGIRYMDMRVGSYNLTDYRSSSTTYNNNQSTRNSDAFFHEELWMVHDIQRNHISLRDALKQIRRFLEQTTHEVVVVDFHRFVNGFVDVDDLFALQSRLRNFYKIVIDELGPFLIPYSLNRRSTIGQMVRDGKRVILGYAFKFDNRGLFDSDVYWPAAQHLWANTDQLTQLESFMKQRLCRQQGDGSLQGTAIHLQSMMAELTPAIDGILFQRYHGLRELAAIINQHYDRWFRQRYWKCVNIVAADFFLGSELVQIAIDVNRKRFGNSTEYDSSIFVV